MLLAIDTSTRNAGAALARDGQVVSAHSWRSAVNHTAELMPAVSQLLTAAGLTVNDLDGITVALGPGGFSALRVGMSVAKGLAMVSGKPLLGVNTLEAEAQLYLKSGLTVCPMLDAGRGEVASACFAPGGQRVREDIICSPEELLEELLPVTAGAILFCGEGLPPYADLIGPRLGSRAVITGHTPAARLWALAELGQRRLTAGAGADLATLQPHYLRMPSIGGPKRRDRVRQ